MRRIPFSAINNLIPALALLFPIVAVFFQPGAAIQLTAAEIAALIAGAFLAAVFSVTLSALKCSTTSFTEVRHV